MLTDEGDKPFIGEIEAFYETPNTGDKKVITKWFYRVEDISQDLRYSKIRTYAK